MPQPSPHSGFFDGVINKSLTVDHAAGGEGFRIHSLSHQDCSEIMEHNKQAMMSGGAKTLSFGKAELCIPELVLQNLKKKYPELAAPDMQIRVKAWKKFLRSTEAKPWRVSVPKYG